MERCAPSSIAICQASLACARRRFRPIARRLITTTPISAPRSDWCVRPAASARHSATRACAGLELVSRASLTLPVFKYVSRRSDRRLCRFRLQARLRLHRGELDEAQSLCVTLMRLDPDNQVRKRLRCASTLASASPSSR
eukprot:5881152-Pleurochrysis_carterae.AAC.3